MQDLVIAVIQLADGQGVIASGQVKFVLLGRFDLRGKESPGIGREGLSLPQGEPVIRVDNRAGKFLAGRIHFVEHLVLPIRGKDAADKGKEEHKDQDTDAGNGQLVPNKAFKDHHPGGQDFDTAAVIQRHLLRAFVFTILAHLCPPSSIDAYAGIDHGVHDIGQHQADLRQNEAKHGIEHGKGQITGHHGIIGDVPDARNLVERFRDHGA